MFCEECGKPITYANAKFCPSCGAPIPQQLAADQPPKVTVPPQPATPVTPPQPETPPEVPQPEPEEEGQTKIFGFEEEPEAPAEPAAPAQPVWQAPPQPETPPQPAQPLWQQQEAPAQPAWQAPQVQGTPEPEAFPGMKKEKKPGGCLLAAVIVLAVLILLGGGLYFANDYFLLGLEKIPQKLGLVEEILPETPQTETDAAETEDPAASAAASSEAAPAAVQTPAATAEPTATVQPSATASDTTYIVRGVPENAAITINGEPAAYTLVGSDVVFQKDALGTAAQLRFVVQVNGTYQAAQLWYTEESGNEITLGSDVFSASDSTGLLTPDEDYIQKTALYYYEGFLDAINVHNLGAMRFSTERNSNEQSEHVFSDLNAGNTYDITTASCSIDAASLSIGQSDLTVNVTYMCMREDRSTGDRAVNSNHRTIKMIWQDGMWQVDDIAFLNDTDFAAHRYADLNK